MPGFLHHEHEGEHCRQHDGGSALKKKRKGSGERNSCQLTYLGRERGEGRGGWGGGNCYCCNIYSTSRRTVETTAVAAAAA